ncbi:MAG: hypothetical protein ATN35_02560 [Epulopiscium sp. Nele67-Bin004]|nr:MAG: hypothetical protein ATN35_02560 [Epulopiscium sp. Nele67-Bin004]
MWEVQVVYTNNIKNPKSEYTYGNNTYTVTPICVSHKNADEILSTIENKLKDKEELTGFDLMDLVFSPVMSGKSTTEERLIKAITITQHHDIVKQQDIQAMLYTFAEKFLQPNELYNIKELIKMTALGKMLKEDGIQEGRQEGKVIGILEGKIELLYTRLDMSAIEIANDLNIPLEQVQQTLESLGLH